MWLAMQLIQGLLGVAVVSSSVVAWSPVRCINRC